jgi:septin 6/8/11
MQQTIQEADVSVDVSLVTSVGYGDQIVRTDSTAPITDYIEKQFEAYLQARQLLEFPVSRTVC